MKCGFFDVLCHGQNIAFGWWAGLPWYAQVGIVVGIGFMLWGMVERAIFAVRKVGEWVNRIGGWKAVVGAAIVAVVAIASIAAAFLPKKPADDLASENVDGPDAEPPPKKRPKPKPPFEFGTDRDKPKKKPKTLQEWFGGLG